MSSNLSPWPPSDEPIVPATVTARLDQIGYSPTTFHLEAHTDRHALIVYANGVLIIDLTDGHEVARYRDLPTAGAAYEALTRRDRGGA